MFTSENEYWEKFMLPEGCNRRVFSNNQKKNHNISELLERGLIKIEIEKPPLKFTGKFNNLFIRRHWKTEKIKKNKFHYQM